MELLKEIIDKTPSEDESRLKKREAARGVFFDEKGLVLLLFVSKHNYYKLPGGGVESGEDKMKALERETKEETGSEIEVTGEVGVVVEFRSKWNLQQTSYCYLGKIKLKGEPNFTKKEIDEGFEIGWFSLDEAISKVKNSNPQNYEGWFIQKRDGVFLEKAKEMIEK